MNTISANSKLNNGFYYFIIQAYYFVSLFAFYFKNLSLKHAE